MQLAVLLLLAAPLLANAATVTVDWNSCPTTRNTAASVLVAADPEWLASGKMSAAAAKGVRGLAEAGADAIRLLNFNIFPGISCAQLEGPDAWNFTAMDAVMKMFMDAVGDASVIIDIETSPAWMWADANATNTQTCADAHSFTLPVTGAPGADPTQLRCPHYGGPHVPKDPTWGQIAAYFKRVADHYTRGGFTDERGQWHAGAAHGPYTFAYWEVLNEVNHAREHAFTPQGIVDFYDAQLKAFAADGGPPPAAKFNGPSWGGMNSVEDVDTLMAPFLNASNHHPPSTPVDAVSFHIYGSCDDPSPAGMERVFTSTHQRVTNGALRRMGEVKRALRPNVELHLTESGICCNKPKTCGANNYTCWYDTQFTPTYWVASASQWLFQFLTYAEAVELASIAQSQILGYPYTFDGLSGEWPSGTMVDWKTQELNAKYYVEIMLLKNVGRPFSYCKTTSSGNGGVYAQALTSPKGRVVVLINTKHTPTTVGLPGATGKRALAIDVASGNGPARAATLASDTVALRAFATVLVQWDVGGGGTAAPPMRIDQ